MAHTGQIYIVGIGGIGVSALARILRGRGTDVAGSDVAASEITEELGRSGISVKIGHRAEQVPRDCDLLIYSNAVPPGNPERVEGAKRGIREQSYPEAVGELLKDYQTVIAVAGTNGKTTTTAMIGWILEQAGYDPTVLVGSKVLAWNSNARVGGRKYFVLEADEYKRAFLHYHPDIAVITNIAADHLDYFKNLADVQSAFAEFARNVKRGGTLVCGDPASSVGQALKVAATQFDNVAAVFRPPELEFKLRLVGKFNQENAAAAAAACRVLGVSEDKIKFALESFMGTWRRFETVGKVGKVGQVGGVEIISDYAHHPDGIRVTLEAAHDYFPGKKILTVFQPHQHNRTRTLFREFVKAFCGAKLNDFVIAEIFDVAGREERRDQDISSRDLVREIEKCGKNVEYAADLDEAERMARERLPNYDMLIFMGAGDIYRVADRISQLK